MFIYRPIGTQFITYDLRQWAKAIVENHFGPAFTKVLKREPRIPMTKKFEWKVNWAGEGEIHDAIERGRRAKAREHDREK